mmetsp:Transcript_4277/g.9301  ORF Transcript_4277/g.9301 Transcript_4277/m.9301 type:complete len:113 (-) Transcript_4277:951-1289(-)
MFLCDLTIHAYSAVDGIGVVNYVVCQRKNEFPSCANIFSIHPFAISRISCAAETVLGGVSIRQRRGSAVASGLRMVSNRHGVMGTQHVCINRLVHSLLVDNPPSSNNPSNQI